MEQSEPANPRALPDERNTIRTQGSAIAAEISGYAEIGMKKEALRLVPRVLTQRRILPEEFREALRTIGLYSTSISFKKWKPKLEAAYNRQSRKFKRAVRSDMLSMYASDGDWENARPFISIRNAWNATEILFSMDVLLALDMLGDAKRLAGRCEKLLPIEKTRFEQSALCEALASFFARTHDWEKAIAVWQQAPLDEPLRRNALGGIVQIHLARAFEAIERGLNALAELKRNPEQSLCLPGNDLGMTLEAQKELLKFKRGIEKLLPEEARKDLGMDVK